MTISAIFREIKIKLYALTLASRCHQCRHWRLKACNFPRRHSCSCKDLFFFLKAGSSSARGHRTTVPTTLQPAPVYIPHTPWLKQTPESSKRSTNINISSSIITTPSPPLLPILLSICLQPALIILTSSSLLFFSFKSQKEHEGQGVMDAYTVLRRRYHGGLDRGVFQETGFQTLLLQRTLDCCSAACFGFLRGHKITILVQSHQHGAWGLLSFTAEHVVVPQRVLWCTVRAHRFDTGLRGRHRTRPTVVWSSLDARLWLFLLGRHLEESDGLVVFVLFFPFFNHCLIMCATELMGNDTFYTV